MQFRLYISVIINPPNAFIRNIPLSYFNTTTTTTTTFYIYTFVRIFNLLYNIYLYYLTSRYIKIFSN